MGLTSSPAELHW